MVIVFVILMRPKKKDTWGIFEGSHHLRDIFLRYIPSQRIVIFFPGLFTSDFEPTL